MLKLEGVVSGYNKIIVLKGVSLRLDLGEMVAVVGPNGAGKTTLLKTISNIIPCKKGKIVFEGDNISKISSPSIVKRGIVQVPEGRQVIAPLSVYDNLLLGAYAKRWGYSKKEKDKQLSFVFNMFPILRDRKRQLSGTLSGGEQQMLAIARALMAKPKLILADEPSIGLAPAIVSLIGAVLKDLNYNGITILLVEQNAALALKVSKRAYVLTQGRVALEGESVKLWQTDLIKKLYLGG